MHTHDLQTWQHEHVLLGDKHEHNERRSWFVVVLTAMMMIVEIIGGHMFGSMALVADGWHMSTHAAALTIAALAYLFSRRHAHDRRFSFGTGKLGELAGFSSAIILGMIALYIGYESIARLINPVSIRFGEAIPIAVLGLGINLLSAWLLQGDQGHHTHAHGHADDVHSDHEHGHHHDHNYRAAYVHVLADALTSVLAIVGLSAGLFYGWAWMDPMMGVIGTCVIGAWSWSLIRSSGAVLLDTVPNPRLADQIQQRLEVGNDRVVDLHLWRIGPGHTAVIASIVSEAPKLPSEYKTRLNGLTGISHVTVEVHLCADHKLSPPAA